MAILCDVHREPMAQVTLQLAGGPNDRWDVESRCCPQAGCNRFYIPIHGYVTVRDRRLQLDERRQRRCPVKSHHLFMAIVRFEGEAPVWKCTDPECGKEFFDQSGADGSSSCTR